MSNKASTDNLFVVGATIFEHLNSTQKAWIEMIENTMVANGYAPPSFPEFSETLKKLGLDKDSPVDLQTVWWEKYQEQVKSVAKILKG